MRVARDSGLTFRLELTDILDHNLDDYTLIELADTRGSRRCRNSQRVQRAVTVSGIRSSPADLYRVRIAPQHYRPRQFFVPLIEAEAASRRIAFPVEPGKVAGIQAPPELQDQRPARQSAAHLFPERRGGRRLPGGRRHRRGPGPRPGLSFPVHLDSGSPPQRIFHPGRRGFNQPRQLRLEFQQLYETLRSDVPSQRIEAMIVS